MPTRVLGLEDLKAKFKQLPTDAGKKVLRRMASAGAKVFKPAIVAATPRKTGRAQAAVLIKFVREQSNDEQSTYIATYRMGNRQQQVKRGRGKNARFVNLDAYYIRFVERGHRKRVGRLRGRKLRNAQGGMVAGRFFFARALRESNEKALDAMIDAGNAEMKKLIP